ncbi:hypothetical protein FPQ18DRAFT_315434 [Pyronema domesticum]|nr:hypothetical protein FPQ18DRAFT_315434 [Pyronema domesticum]
MDELTSLRYLKPLPLYTHSKPYYIFETLPSGIKNTNLEYEDGPAQLITDIRGQESEFTLKEHGFEFIKWEPPELDWGNEKELYKIYFPAVRKCLEALLGEEVKRWELYEFRRRHAGLKSYGNPDVHNHMAIIPPVPIIHVDQSPAGILNWLKRNLADEVDELVEKYRMRLFTVWRPLVDVVEDVSLAVCDARTFSREDLIEVDFIDNTMVRKNFMAKYSESAKFYYLSKMTKDECCVFKVFDSLDLEKGCVPHGAFRHANYGKDVKPRESIEVRFLIMTEK